MKIFFLLAALAFRGLDVAEAAPGLPSMLGTYQCINHEGATVWRFTSSNTIYGSWILVHASFAPQNGQPAQRALTFVGFDPDSKRWNIISIDSGGSYYTRYSASPDVNGSHWVDGDPADGARSVLRIKGPHQYTFDLTLPGERGTSTISHVVCTRP